jgi:hypothetical protein
MLSGDTSTIRPDWHGAELEYVRVRVAVVVTFDDLLSAL